MDQPWYGCQGQLNRKHVFALSQFAPENLASRDGFGRPVLRQSAHCPYSGSIWCLLAGFLPLSSKEFIYPVNRHPVNPKLIRSHAIVCRRRSMPRVLRRRADSPRGSSSKRGLPLQETPLTVFCAPLFSHSHYWYNSGHVRYRPYPRRHI